MIPGRPAPKYAPGTRLDVVQHVRVGHRRWSTQVTGIVLEEGLRPVGGMEMGTKALYCHELLVVAVDENTEVRVTP